MPKPAAEDLFVLARKYLTPVNASAEVKDPLNYGRFLCKLVGSPYRERGQYYITCDVGTSTFELSVEEDQNCCVSVRDFVRISDDGSVSVDLNRVLDELASDVPGDVFEKYGAVPAKPKEEFIDEERDYDYTVCIPDDRVKDFVARFITDTDETYSRNGENGAYPVLAIYSKDATEARFDCPEGHRVIRITSAGAVKPLFSQDTMDREFVEVALFKDTAFGQDYYEIEERNLEKRARSAVHDILDGTVDDNDIYVKVYPVDPVDFYSGDYYPAYEAYAEGRLTYRVAKNIMEEYDLLTKQKTATVSNAPFHFFSHRHA